ncbi:alpha/beta fold hydrolase [Streptomyces sp. NPDC001388]|uniref:alpha/beta hydrolase n=1 Tax=unclassified Streptomyces TaxID=2593676 RepID=UPI003673DEC8
MAQPVPEASTTTVEATASRRPSLVQQVELRAGDIHLSGLLALPPDAPPRAVVVALHGSGMAAGYFHGQADASTSLLSLAAGAGYAALALDRPGYGASARRLPHGLCLTEQARCVRAALRAYSARWATGAGFLLVGHSLGGKVALTTAATARRAERLLGVDVSGVGARWAVPPDRVAALRHRPDHRLHWGPLTLYPPDTFRLARGFVAPVPAREADEIPDWPGRYAEVARRIRVPVRFTFAEYERLWAWDPPALRELTSSLAAPLVRVDHEPDAGHNISLGHTARRHHLRLLDFLEECRVQSGSAG